jgi:phage-related baseplate assembly protein
MSQLNFSPINLSQLPAPNIIEKIDFEAIKAEIINDYKARFPAAEVGLASESVIKLIETVAYREMLMRQRVNDGANAVLLANAKGSELDFLGNRFNVLRQLITEKNKTTIPPTQAVYESDERFKQRIQLSLEGFSTAGPVGAYVFHAMATSAQVKDIAIDSPRFTHANLDAAIKAQLPEGTIVLTCTYDAGLTNPSPGDIAITTLSTQGNGAPDEDLASAVLTKLSADDIRPLTDHVRRRDVEIIEYALEANLYMYTGPDTESVRLVAVQAVTDYIKSQHKIGRDITLSGLYAALHQPGVQRVELVKPTSNIVVNGYQAAFCNSIKVTIGGYDE